MQRKIKARAVWVKWLDSKSAGAWRDLPEYAGERCCLIESVGWLIHRDRERTVLVQSLSDLGHAADSISIPTSCVRQLRCLERPRARRRPR